MLWRVLSVFFVFLVFLLFVSIPFLQRGHIPILNSSNTESFQAKRQNIWADLSDHEAKNVVDFLYLSPDLNLTKPTEVTRNFLSLLEVLQPNKTDVLLYLNGSSGPPARWARASILQRLQDEGQVIDYMIGPLPPSNSTKILPLDYCYNSGRNRVAVSMPAGFDMGVWTEEFGKNVSDITEALLGSHMNESDPDALEIRGRVARIENSTVSYWLQFYRPGVKSDAATILPQGLYAYLETSTKYPIGWKTLQWYYNGLVYSNASDLRAAMQRPDFQKSVPNLDGDWTDIEDSDGIPGREKAPPTMIQPGGKRFSIDREQKFVSWMGFELFITVSQSTALALHDIRFHDESIIYELGLQEALVHYAGDDPEQAGLEFLDSMAAMGLGMFELVPGYDCPAYATFLSSTFSDRGATITNKNSICIFEYTADYPLQRHTSAQVVSISKNTYLVIRSVSSVGNYDYTIDYIFYLDGSIEVKVRASGFIYGAFYNSNPTDKLDKYGYRVHDAAATSMHDHVLNFKADLDVAGTNNTLVRVGIESVSRSYPWDYDDDDKRTSTRNTMHLVTHDVDIETGLDWPRNSGEMYIVQNQDATNSWGERRGYRIHPGSGMGTPSHLTIHNSTSVGKSASWSAKDLWVVKQKDEEPKSASPWNYLCPQDPLVDFQKFVNGEDVVQDDLVIYFNLGSHHIPHSGDIPNTLMHTSASSVMFSPFNFHDRDASRRAVQGVTLDLGPEGTRPRYYGGRYTEGVTLAKTDLEPDLTQYAAEEHKVLGWGWEAMRLRGWN